MTTNNLWDSIIENVNVVHLPSSIEDVMEAYPEMTYEQAEEEFNRLYDEYEVAMNWFERG